MQRLPNYLVLAAARPADPYLTWEVVPEHVQYAASEGSSVVWAAPSPYHGKLWLTGMGQPAAVARLLHRALDSPVGRRAVGISLPPPCFAALDAELRPGHLEHWTWWWTQQAAGAPDPAVVPLDAGDERLPALLAQSRSVYLQPGDARVHGWFGLVEEGALRACLAHERHHPEIPHLASVVVDEAARGQGFGARLCGSVTTLLLASAAPAVSLAMMTENRAAAALYSSLGFAAGGSFASGTIPGRRSYPVEPGWVHP